MVYTYQKSAEQGVPIAQYLLGTSYHFGRGLPQDEKLAQEWLEKAAEQDYRDAQYALGMCLYYQEVTSEAEDSQAVYWFQKAAEQGDIPSKCQLGICYLDGNGVKRDTKYTLRLFREAADAGDAEAQFADLAGDGSMVLYEEDGCQQDEYKYICRLGCSQLCTIYHDADRNQCKP